MGLEGISRGVVNGIIGVLIVLIIVLAGVYHFLVWKKGDRFTLSRTREVKSSVDGSSYRVHLVHANASTAADTMAELNQKAIDLMRHLRKKYIRTSGGPPGRVEAVRRLLDRYNPDNLAENSPQDPEGDTSYTIDKGAILALCLREKDPTRSGDPATHDIHDLETLTFVTFHELSHIAVEDVDHPKRFWRAFKFILEEARETGLLRGIDYERRPTTYCGMNIDYNPLFDRELQPLA